MLVLRGIIPPVPAHYGQRGHEMDRFAAALRDKTQNFMSTDHVWTRVVAHGPHPVYQGA